MKTSTFTTVPPGGEAVAMAIKTCADTTTVQSIVVPDGISAFYISVATTDANVTFNGTDPTAGTGVHLIPHGAAPILILVAPPKTGIKAVSTASANAVISVTWLY